jgi:hypothetical protein
LPTATKQPGNELWADNKSMVVGTTFLLPQRCLKTNVSDALSLEKITVRLSGGEKVVLRAPFNAKYLSRRQLHFVISPLSILFGALVIAFGLFSMANARGNDPLVDLAMPIIGLGFVMLVGGIVYWVAANSALLRGGKKVGDHAWIDGVSPKYLAELPKWNGPTSTPGTMPEIAPANSLSNASPGSSEQSLRQPHLCWRSNGQQRYRGKRLANAANHQLVHRQSGDANLGVRCGNLLRRVIRAGEWRTPQ